ncbi:MAG: glycosyl hydrolase 2 galactose-binding domain-containing protein, partial [Planctomycetota bacterium]
GLDTVASVELNGHQLGHTANMHRGYRFPARQALRPGENRLAVRFTSPYRYAEQLRDRLGDRPGAYPEPYQFIRKMACNFGWDWGPTLITCGIFKPIYLVGWSNARIDSVRPLVTHADEQSATVEVLVEMPRASGRPHDVPMQLEAALLDPDGNEVRRESVSVTHDAEQRIGLEIGDPRLWWPRGYGDQPLYTVNVRLRVDRGEGLDRWTGRVGLRTVRLNTDADEIGSQMTLEVNGKAVFCKGANWIPDDCFPTRVTEADYRRRIEQACEANMNMLRIWGGGIYETDTFYDICDELGVMVWQDFLFACAAYPEDSPFWEQVELEATHNITRLSPHPSLVIWNGCNENIWGYFDWGWQDALDGRAWGAGYYFDLLPRLVEQLDPTRPYWPGSPYSGTMEIHPLDDAHGNQHIWDVWNARDYRSYRENKPRFASEFGFQAPATYATLRQALPEKQLRPVSPAMLHHQKAGDGHSKLQARLEEHFQSPENFDDWLYLTQLNQARALTTGVEWLRALQPRCMGTLYWQINDCWPVTSWAAVDDGGRPKPLWYATRRFFAPRLLTIQPTDDGLGVFAVNDTDEQWDEPVTVTRMDFDGNALAAVEAELTVPPRGCVAVEGVDPALLTPEDPTRELAVAQAGAQRGLWFFEIDRNLRYPQPAFESYLSDDGGELVLTAQTLLRDLAIFPDRLDAEATVDDQLVTLLPGESATFRIDSPQPLAREKLTAPPVLQCANRFGQAR